MQQHQLMDARANLARHEKRVRVARGNRRDQSRKFENEKPNICSV